MLEVELTSAEAAEHVEAFIAGMRQTHKLIASKVKKGYVETSAKGGAKAKASKAKASKASRPDLCVADERRSLQDFRNTGGGFAAVNTAYRHIEEVEATTLDFVRQHCAIGSR